MRLPIAVALTRLLTRGLDFVRVGRVLGRDRLLPLVDEYLGLLRRVDRPSTLEVRAPARQRMEAISTAIRVAPFTALGLGVAAAVGGIACAVAGQRLVAVLLFLCTGALFGTAVLAWLTHDAIALVLRHPLRADAAWLLIVVLFGLTLPR